MKATGQLEELGYDRSILQALASGSAATRRLFPFPDGTGYLRLS